MALWEEFNNIDTQAYAKKHPTLFSYVKEEMVKSGKQFLLIGDTDHTSGHLQHFLNSPTLPALLKHANIPHVSVEIPRETAPPGQLAQYRAQREAYQTHQITAKEMEQLEKSFWKKFETSLWDCAERYQSNSHALTLAQLNKKVRTIRNEQKDGIITPDAATEELDALTNSMFNHSKSLYGPRLLAFIHAGLHVTAADSWQWAPSGPLDMATRFFLGDREVSHYIQDQAQGQKTAAIYGAGHLRYNGTLRSHLGQENSLYIDIHLSRASHIRQSMEQLCYTDTLPDRVYFVLEDLLEEPNPALYRATERTIIQMQTGKNTIVNTYGPDANPGKKAAAIAEIKKTPDINPEYFNYVPPINTPV